MDAIPATRLERVRAIKAELAQLRTDIAAHQMALMVALSAPYILGTLLTRHYELCDRFYRLHREAGRVLARPN